MANFGVNENPRESLNWRRRRQGCPHYRERWFVASDPDAGEPLYQVFCLMNTPPETAEEQQRCLTSRTCCWRIAEAARRGARTAATSGASEGKRRRSAS